MDGPLLVVLVLAAVTGAIATPRWLRQADDDGESRTYWHGGTTALVLVVLLLGLDHQLPGANVQLLAIFFSIATGMLLFLQRQRQRHYSRLLLAVHIALATSALIVTGIRLV